MTILLALVYSPLLLAEDPFSEPQAGEPRRPPRSILKLPAAVTHKTVESGRHEYRISNIYHFLKDRPADKDSESEDDASSYGSSIPDCDAFHIDATHLTATFTTTRELALSELADAIDEMANLGGEIPYWAELEARDLPTSNRYPNLRYLALPVAEPPPPNLAWFWLPDDREFRMPLSIGGPDLCTLLVVPSTAFCMSCSRFSIRILDPDGKVIWKDGQTAYAEMRIALENAGETGMHKIWLTRDDHGTKSVAVITGEFVMEKDKEPDPPPAGYKPGN